MKTVRFILFATVMLSAGSNAMASDLEANGIAYDIISDSEAEVTRLDGDSKYHDYVEIPESVRINGKIYSVTRIGDDAFLSCDALTSVVMPETITEIGENAFRGCENLSGITIPSSVKRICDGAFRKIPMLGISFNSEVCPEFDRIFSEGYPSYVTVPADAVDSYMENAPELFADRYRLSVGFSDDDSDYYGYIPFIFNGRAFVEETEDDYLELSGNFLRHGTLSSQKTLCYIRKSIPVSILIPWLVGLGPLQFKLDGKIVEDHSEGIMNVGIATCPDSKILDSSKFGACETSFAAEFISVEGDHVIEMSFLPATCVDNVASDEIDNKTRLYRIDGTPVNSLDDKSSHKGIHIIYDGERAVKKITK